MAFLELLINKRFLLYLTIFVGSTIMSIIFFTALYAGKGVGSHDILFLIEEYGFILLGLTVAALASVVFEVYTTPKLQDPESYKLSNQQSEIERLKNLLNERNSFEATRSSDRSLRFRDYAVTIPSSEEECHSLLKSSSDYNESLVEKTTEAYCSQI